jgi:hypothetical protein
MGGGHVAAASSDLNDAGCGTELLPRDGADEDDDEAEEELEAATAGCCLDMVVVSSEGGAGVVELWQTSG